MLDRPTLANAETGLYRCGRIEADGIDALRIKRMGLCEGLSIEVLGTGDPMIVRAGHSHIGLSRFIAQRIEVHALDDQSDGDLK